MSRHPKYFQAHFCSFQETPLASKTLFIPLPELLKHPHWMCPEPLPLFPKSSIFHLLCLNVPILLVLLAFLPHFILLGIMVAIHSDGARFSQFVGDGQEGEIKSKSNLKRSRKCHKLVRK